MDGPHSRATCPSQRKKTLSVAASCRITFISHRTPHGTYLCHSRLGNLRPTPFWSARGEVGHHPTLAFVHLIGLTDPCLSAVDMESFSTSAIKFLCLSFCYQKRIPKTAPMVAPSVVFGGQGYMLPLLHSSDAHAPIGSTFRGGQGSAWVPWLVSSYAALQATNCDGLRILTPFYKNHD